MFAILFTAVSAGAFLALRQTERPLSTTSRADSTFLPTLPPSKKVSVKEQKTPSLKEYSDPAGFRFLYPSNVSLVSELDEADSNLYSSIRLKPQTEGGYVSLKISGSNFTRIDDWLKANGISKNNPDVEKIKLGDLDAYQATSQKQKVTGALDTGAIITVINTDPEDPVLTKAYNSLLETFAFYQPEGAEVESQPQAAPSESGGEIIESEEVIE